MVTASAAGHGANPIFVWGFLISLGIAILGSTFPLYKSATRSPESIERRFYWTGGALACVMLFLSQLPNWRAGTFGALAAALVLVCAAFFYSGHIKINGRVYSGFSMFRKPDSPPARRVDDD